MVGWCGDLGGGRGLVGGGEEVRSRRRTLGGEAGREAGVA